MSLRKSTVLSGAIALTCVAAMLVLTIANLNGLADSVNRRTHNYLRDVSEQSAQVIEERFAGLLNGLEIIGNSLAFSAVSNDDQFLRMKIVLTEFDALAYVRMDGTCVMVDKDGHAARTDGVFETCANSTAFQNALRGITSASLYDDRVAFLEPITLEGRPATSSEGVKGIMCGTRTRESLEDLLVNNAFGSSGHTFIVDQHGEILARPAGDESHALLHELMTKGISDVAATTSEGNMAPSSKESTLRIPGGGTLLIDYEPLDMFGWAVVTAVDEGFLANVVNSYVMRIIVTVVVLMIIVALALLVLVIMQRRYQKRIESLAFVDSLTNGMSFIRFRMLAEQTIAQEANQYALVTVNVKRFKLVNRLGGSIEGDDLLRRIHQILKANLQNTDELLAHNTADSFVMLLRNDGEAELEGRLERIASEIEQLQSVIPVRVSQGVYVLSDPDIDIIMFLDRSNTARTSQKREYNSTIVFYDDEFVERQEQRLRMIGLVEDALQNDQFTVYLQPKVSPTTDEIMGSEALVRWIHPTQGMIGPDVFVPLCEEHGLICELDLYVFRRVCEQVQKWHERGWEPRRISVNVSGMHLKNLEFVKMYREIADKHEVDPTLIELEITESIMFSDIGVVEARSVIDTIHEFGFHCSMDDFGSGYSALGLLAELPIDCIKLDRSFFVDCIGNERAQTVIAAIIRLAHALQIATVAEGIETKAQVDMLRALGCDMIQGFYYSHPLPMHEFAQMAFESFNPFKSTH